ncbi:MAG: VCBS repeat-containing protein, partial [Gammaproteobacteria bacterium]|nr:VCBS repeat-containing protein [Gammaproteobacteria bacterium]
MNDGSGSEANDKIIGLAFRRSLLFLALVATVVVAVMLLGRLLQQEKALVEAPAIAPVEMTEEAPAPAVRFTDITRQAGIAFTHFNGAYGDKLLPETMGSGVAFFDYDNDGDQDLLLINSDHWPDQDLSGDETPGMALYQNDGRGQFTDVTAAAGLAVPLYGMGAAVGDYDNDGDPDLFVTTYGTNHLFRNDGGRFEAVTAAAGVAGAPDSWSTSAAFADIDNDGDLDLFVANYVGWSRELDFNVNFQLTGIGRAYGPPNAYPGSHSYLYRNDGEGRFVDISAAAGIQVDNPTTGQPMGKALAVAPVDIDGDGWMDLLVANDTVQNFLFHNQGDGVFAERGSTMGVAFDRNGQATGAMGVDIAHFRNDADLGVAIGNFANEMSSLYVTQGAAPPFTDEAIVAGIGPTSRRALTFGLYFFDYDLDGRLDLLQANGHLEAEINKVQSSQQHRQSAQLYWNCGADCRSSFVPQPADSIGDLGTPIVGRGASYADID